MRAIPFLPAATDPKVALLSTLPAFSHLTNRQLRRLVPLLDELDVAEGSVLVHQGELPREFVVVVDGHATVERDGEPIGNVGPGAFVGEMALLERRSRRNATVRALSPMTVLVGDSRVLDAVLDVDAGVRQGVEATARHRAQRNTAA